MVNASSRPKPVVLLILDGFGIAPDDPGNAVTRADTPVFDKLVAAYPTLPVRASGEAVGLAWGDMGNSEVGHLTLGAGRVYYQSLPRIDLEIEKKTFFENKVLVEAVEKVKQTGGALHLAGLVSAGKVHGMNTHLYALLELAKLHKVKEVYVHAFLDGRDTLYNSGYGFIEELLLKMKELKTGELATMSGRHYAMDRDNKWDRTKKAYSAMVLAEGEKAEDPLQAIKASYAKELYDEQFVPTVLTKKGEPIATIESGDAVICFNFRPDRMRQMAKALVMPEFDGFERSLISELHVATMMEYEKGLPVRVAFVPEVVTKGFAEVVSNVGLTQVHIAETEKYAHVTFFFNGTREEPFPGEDRILIPSPKVASYDETPEMSAGAVTDAIVKAVREGKHDVVIANYANPDMVAHTGNLEASKEAMAFVDKMVGKVADAVLAVGGVLCITADHGNVEEVANLQTGDIDKEHSTNPVPFIIVGRAYEGQSSLVTGVPGSDLSLIPPVGVLADVAPTLLHILGIPQPDAMTGQPLI